MTRQIKGDSHMEEPRIGTGNLTIRQLEIVMVASKSESFSAAAKKLGVTQPSLSTAIAQVERVLGVQLFNRAGRSVTVTTHGARLAVAATELLHIYRSAVRGIQNAEATTTKIRLGVLPGIGAWVAPAAVREFRAACPGFDVALYDPMPSEGIQLLLDGILDFMILTEPPDISGLEAEIIGKTYLQIVVSKDSALAKRDSVGWQDLASESLIHAGGLRRRGYVQRLWEEAGYDLRSRYEVNETATGIGLAAEGLGFVLTPDYFHPEIVDARLAAVPLSSDAAGRNLYLVRLKGSKLSAEARILIDLIQAKVSPAAASEQVSGRRVAGR